MVSNVYGIEKSAESIRVSSPFFIALFISSLMAIKIVAVEWPFLKPDILSLRQLSIKGNCCLRTSLSYILDKTGRIAISLKSSWVFGASVLGMGDILEIFQAEGNELASIQEFMMCVRGAEIIPATGLMYLMEFDQDLSNYHYEDYAILLILLLG